MSAPAYQATGSTVQSTGAITVSWPEHLTDDVALLFVESANQAVTLSTAAGFTEIPSAIGTGTAGVAGATRLTVFWARATSAAMASPVVADSGTRQTAFIMTFRGCITSGNPYDVVATSAAASATAISFPSVTTTVDEALIVTAMTNPQAIAAATVQPGSLVNAGLTNLVKRANTQSDGVGGGDPGTNEDFLPVGLMAFGGGSEFGEVGEGPGLDASDPRCTICMFVPNPSTIGGIIDTADTHNILLLLNVSGNKPSWSTTIGGVLTLDMGKYEQNVRRFAPDNTNFAARVKFADAVRRKRIVFYCVDEPNLTNDSNPNHPNISPSQVNQMGLIHKAVWTGFSPITIVRCAANTLFSGWNGLSRPAGGYTGVDYAWVQYNNNHGKGNSGTTLPWTTPEDPRDVWAEQRAVIANNNMNLGLVASHNVWAGGHGVDSLGVTAKWDVNNNGGTLAYVAGNREANEGDVVAEVTNSMKSVQSNPDWIRKFAELAAADPDLPFFMYWQHATTTNPSHPQYNYYIRSDYEQAFDDAITTGLARTQFNGWRTPK